MRYEDADATVVEVNAQWKMWTHVGTHQDSFRTAYTDGMSKVVHSL